MKVTIESVRLSLLPEMFGGRAVFSGDISEKSASFICTDSRECCEGAIFFAIRGENTDGHKYIKKAAELGAFAVVCEYIPEDAPRDCFYVVTENTEKALLCGASFSRSGRERLRSCAVTGSVGKTTAKEVIWSALSEAMDTYKTDGNFNSVIGMPIALMAMPSKTENAVFEMGMSARGEIRSMSSVLLPDVAVITNVGHSHLEYLKTRENILLAKLEVTDGLSPNGTLIINGDDEMLATVDYNKYPFKTVRASVLDENAEYFASDISFADGFMCFELCVRQEKICSVRIPGIGKHLVLSALFALAVADSFGADIAACAKGIEKFRNAAMRQNVTSVGEFTVIEDCYNAAPESMRSALESLSIISKEKTSSAYAVLGEMRELGEDSDSLHYEVGVLAAGKKPKAIIGVGRGGAFIARGAVSAGMAEADTYVFEDPEDFEKVAELLSSLMAPKDVLLVKASRGLKAERIIEAFKKRIK